MFKHGVRFLRPVQHCRHQAAQAALPLQAGEPLAAKGALGFLLKHRVLGAQIKGQIS